MFPLIQEEIKILSQISKLEHWNLKESNHNLISLNLIYLNDFNLLKFYIKH